MNRRPRISLIGPLILVAVLALAIGLALLIPEEQAAERRPNIVLLIADDLGWPYYGFMGDPVVQTPHIDSLARGGVTFDMAHVSSSICQPSLRTLLTGLSPRQWNEKVAALRRRQRLPESEEIVHFNTLARELEHVGYRTFQGGKYWEGTAKMGGFSDGTKTEIGTNLGESSGGASFGREGIEPFLDFIDEPSSHPFFVWFAPMLPHLPYDAADSYHAPYEGLELPRRTAQYYANTTRLDDVVGDLLTALKARGIRDDTLIVFMSDNGWEENASDPDPLRAILGDRRGKLSINELGFRTPLIFNRPGTLAPQRRLDLVTAQDIFQTVVDYARASAPADAGGQSIRVSIETGAAVGRDRVFGEMLTLRNPEWRPKEPFQRNDRAYFVRTEEWRYIYYETRGYSELFHIVEDPFEDFNILSSNTAVGDALHAEVVARIAEESATADTYEITGTFAGPDATARATPIAGIQVVVRGTTVEGRQVHAESTSGDSGFFRVGGLPPGRYTVTPKANGLRFLSYDNHPVHEIEVSLPFANASEHLHFTVDLA